MEMSPEIVKIIEDKAKQGITFRLGAQINLPSQLVFEFSDGSQITVSESGIHYLPPSKGNT